MTDALAAGRRGDWVAAAVLFAVVNLTLIAINGVRYGGDTGLYLDGAARLLDGRPLVDREPSYVGYVAVVAAAQALGIGTFGLVLFQVLLGSLAAATVFAIGAALAGRIAGLVAAILVSFDVDTNRWHQFILADSVFVSLFVIGVWLTHLAAARGGAHRLVTALTVAVCAGLVRPEGWFFLPAAAGYVIVMRAVTPRQRLASAAAAFGVATVLWAVLSPMHRGNVQAVGPADMLQRGQTIWDFDGWRVDMPPGDAGDAISGDQAGSAIRYAMRHPFSTMQLMAARVAVHFAHVRPFYSTAHNVVIVLWLVPIYALTLFALWRLGMAPLPVWIVTAIATQTIVVALTHAEWDGRYLAHVLPVIDPLVGAGVAIATSKAVMPEQHPVHA